MALHLYNTASRQKEEFVPRDPANVGMYVCGPTVYDTAHIGNARPVIIFDVLARLLRLQYGDAHVNYVRNITDVEDKIIAAAEANGESIEALTTRTTKAYHEDMAEMGALPPNREPKATEHIVGMVEMIGVLMEKGHAYEAEGHVLFDVTSMADYGKLSGRNRDDMIAGARVEIAPYKKDPADFVLWKPSADDIPGWDSPWGRGRPGWHIECSVMSRAELGDTFDIHGGGRDLIFPHHENEVAQSCCANGDGTFARYWVHNGFLTVEGDKMSKSLGNFRTVRELLAEAPGEALRLNMLSAHYRQPLDWTSDGVKQSKTNLDKLYTSLQSLSDVEADESQVAKSVLDALEDDINTPKALAALYALSSAANKETNLVERSKIKGKLLSGGNLLGLLQQDPKEWFQGAEEGDVTADQIEALILERVEAKTNKNYARSDEIRDSLKDQGIVLEDSPQGTTWKRV
ncbi:MAG: cysteine--tRNA ligase [Sneathiella sp.]|nr:cysteine--tRNA ligase [Sneathiella sp.]